MSDAPAMPYRTGTYLIFDSDAARPAKDGNFRSGRGLDPPLRASGSHQLDAAPLASVIDRVASEGPELDRLTIVDLRQESHVFVDGRAVSWCAGKDWSNVGQTPAWIARDEQCQLEKLAVEPETVVFTVRKSVVDGEIQVVATTPARVTRAETEEMVVARLPSRLALSYVRLPVTDHCAPDDDAIRAFRQVLGNVPPTAWVHFHCHGGDGRTTTFLMMYDMMSVAWTPPRIAWPPDLEYFRQRQLRLFHYDPRPDATSKRWQLPLSEARWRRLESFREYVFGGDAVGGPWPGRAP